MAIGNLEGTAQPFLYNGLVAFGSAVTDYDTATVGDIMDSMVGVGAIPDGTTEYTGEDASLENWVDEGGNVLDVTVTAGSQGFSFELASLSAAQVQRWFDASLLTIPGYGDDNNIASGAQMYGVVDIPIQELPALVINQSKSMAIFYPKMRVVASVAYADKKFTISVQATALQINTSVLKTFNFIYGGVNMD